MRNFLLSILCLLGVITSIASSQMVPSNILQRVFCIRPAGANTFGSAFTIEVNNDQFLITARHVLPSNPQTGTIEILRNSAWEKLDFESVPVEPANVDIAVLALTKQISPLLPIEVGFLTSFLSQPVFFVGFPYFLSIDGGTVNGGYPVPFVKHGIIAGFGAKGEPFFIDAMNNPGFSGGPVVRVDDIKRPTIIGVISGYRFEQVGVQQGSVATNLSVPANTGITLAYSIDYATQAIEKITRGRHQSLERTTKK